MEALILAALALLLAAAALAAVRRLKRGGGCCGEHETVKLNRVADRNKAHYPYLAEAELGGMSCDNCARRAANALNALEGVWATVSFDTKKAVIRFRQPPEEAAVRQAVAGAGYVVMRYAELPPAHGAPKP